MPAPFRPFWHIVLVVLLFAGSLAVLLYSVFHTLALPRREAEAREKLRQASQQMATAAAPTVATLPAQPNERWNDINRELAEITRRVLADLPGVEGGFYLDTGLDRFAGYAYPTDPHHSLPEPPRTDPPPLEAPYIRLQARQSLASPPGCRGSYRT